jgi:hypothetical protein
MDTFVSRILLGESEFENTKGIDLATFGIDLPCS